MGSPYGVYRRPNAAACITSAARAGRVVHTSVAVPSGLGAITFVTSGPGLPSYPVGVHTENPTHLTGNNRV